MMHPRECDCDECAPGIPVGACRVEIGELSTMTGGEFAVVREYIRQATPGTALRKQRAEQAAR